MQWKIFVFTAFTSTFIWNATNSTKEEKKRLRKNSFEVLAGKFTS